MNYKEQWGQVRDARKAWRKALKNARQLKSKTSDVWNGINSDKAVLARKMRACPTPCESILADALRDSGFQFETQVQVGPYIADFLIFKGRTVVEVDGPIHDQQTEYDRRRDRYMWNARYRVIRFKNAEVTKDAKAVITKLKKFMAE